MSKHRNVKRRRAYRYLKRMERYELANLMPAYLRTASIERRYAWWWEHFGSSDRGGWPSVPWCVVHWTNPRRTKHTARQQREWLNENRNRGLEQQ